MNVLSEWFKYKSKEMETRPPKRILLCLLNAVFVESLQLWDSSILTTFHPAKSTAHINAVPLT